jgi:glyoxylase-like metal-dependent hydrolase (beta-lactamase superfamily II)
MSLAAAVPASEHFQLEEVAPGIYAAIASDTGGAFSNAGIVDLGGATLVFDTLATPQAARDLRATAERLTGRPARWVVNSHFHSDHWLGNQVFADAPIVATHRTRAAMPAGGGYIYLYKENPAEFEKELQETEAAARAATEPAQRLVLERTVARGQHTLAALPTLELRLPDQTFHGKLVFHGTTRVAELIAPGRGHTTGDAYLALPADGIAFTGDLCFFASPPFMASCDPLAWQTRMEELERSPFTTFVPGHGPLGTKQDVALQRQYVLALQEIVARVVREGGSLEQALAQPLPGGFADWEVFAQRSKMNVEFLYRRAQGRK